MRDCSSTVLVMSYEDRMGRQQITPEKPSLAWLGRNLDVILRLIFLRKIMVIDGVQICHCSIFTSRSTKVVFVWTEIAAVDL